MKWYKINISDYTDQEYQRWYSLMSESKKKRVDRFRFDDDKKRTVFGEMLARKALSQWCGVDKQSIVFGQLDNGKPYAKKIDAHFNISHSNDVVVCAVSDVPVGIDVEKIRPVDLSVSKRVCTDDELCYLFGHAPVKSDFVYTTDTEILTRFFKLWCSKEAYAKCSGKGLCGGLSYTPEIEKTVIDGYVICVYQQEKL